jgi:steroid 5-alpha reductase family enzyme
VKKYIGSSLFFFFNVTFISLYQSILLWSITTPTYLLLLTQRLATYDSRAADVGWEDWGAAGLMLSSIAVSFVADQQQWNYQQAKSEYQKTAKVPVGYERADMDRGFLTKGLFAHSRHPNFAAEQSVWVALYLWSCLATKTWYNWSGAGALAYLMLFQGSTWLTELLSSNKYPDYSTYQKQVGRFLPGPRSGPWKFPDQNGPAAHKPDADLARQRYDLR